MNFRGPLYFGYATARGHAFPQLLEEFTQRWRQKTSVERGRTALVRLLRHCRDSVPYYSQWMQKRGCDPDQPEECLRRLPLLTKQIIRDHWEQLQSADLSQRRWHYNTSGGSTGEPIRLIQDDHFDDHSTAVTLFYRRLIGHEPGDRLVRLWGSERDLENCRRNWRAQVFAWLQNTSNLNAFQMTPGRMREFLKTLNQGKPCVIWAYAQSIYELADFAALERFAIRPPRAVIASAGTLYSFMRERIASVFGCPVFNLYGSREVGAIACELPGGPSLWVHPEIQWIEIIDENNCPVPAGTPGQIIVTCLTNYAMPLIRYDIGDRGVLGPVRDDNPDAPEGQRLAHVLGRSVDTFRRQDGTLIDGEYFTHLLYFRPWVQRYRIIQCDYSSIRFQIVGSRLTDGNGELEEIRRKTRQVMGADCHVEIEFVEELLPSASGKYRYTISEVR